MTGRPPSAGHLQTTALTAQGLLEDLQRNGNLSTTVSFAGYAEE